MIGYNASAIDYRGFKFPSGAIGQKVVSQHVTAWGNKYLVWEVLCVCGKAIERTTQSLRMARKQDCGPICAACMKENGRDRLFRITMNRRSKRGAV